MRLKLSSENRIVGYGNFSNSTYPAYDWVDCPEKLIDDMGQPLYIWDGEKPVYSPITYDDEQIEVLRKQWCETQIRASYPVSVENKILRENITLIANGKEPNDEYITYNTTISSIIQESKIKDFQIT